MKYGINCITATLFLLLNCLTSKAQTMNDYCVTSLLKNATLETIKNELDGVSEKVAKTRANDSMSIDDKNWSLTISEESSQFGLQIQNFRRVVELYKEVPRGKNQNLENIIFRNSLNSILGDLDAHNKAIRVVIPIIRDSGLANAMMNYRNQLEKIESEFVLCK